MKRVFLAGPNSSLRTKTSSSRSSEDAPLHFECCGGLLLLLLLPLRLFCLLEEAHELDDEELAGAVAGAAAGTMPDEDGTGGGLTSLILELLLSLSSYGYDWYQFQNR
jgi:hypothetical protein